MIESPEQTTGSPLTILTRRLLQTLIGERTDFPVADEIHRLLHAFLVFGFAYSQIFVPAGCRLDRDQAADVIVDRLSRLSEHELVVLLQKFTKPQIIVVPTCSLDQMVTSMNRHKLGSDMGLFGNAYLPADIARSFVVGSDHPTMRLVLVETVAESFRSDYKLEGDTVLAYGLKSQALADAGLQVADLYTVLAMSQYNLMHYNSGGACGLMGPCISDQRTSTVAPIQAGTTKALMKVNFRPDSQYRIQAVSVEAGKHLRNAYIRPAWELGVVQLS